MHSWQLFEVYNQIKEMSILLRGKEILPRVSRFLGAIKARPNTQDSFLVIGIYYKIEDIIISKVSNDSGIVNNNYYITIAMYNNITIAVYNKSCHRFMYHKNWKSTTSSTKWVKWVSESHSVVSDSLWPHGLYSAWNSPGQNTGVGSLSLLQGIFPTQGSNPGLPQAGRFFTSWATGKTKNPRVGSPSLLQWIFPTQESNQGLLHCRHYQGSPVQLKHTIN